MGKKHLNTNVEADLSRGFKGLSCADALAVASSDDMANYQQDRNRAGRGISEQWTQDTTKANVEQAIEKNLLEWGLDPNSRHCPPQDREFFECAIRAAINSFDWKGPIKIDDSVPQVLSVDKRDAIKHVLHNEIDNPKETYYVVDDKVSEIRKQHLAFPPFWVNREMDGSLKTPVLKQQFKNVQHLLNPFDRFTCTTRSKQEYFERHFFDKDQEQALAGHVYEAMVASHAIHDESVRCKSCGCSSSLRWMGGYAAPWKDLVCTSCKSTYEIKSKQSNIKIKREIERNSIGGGSFSVFYDLKREVQDHTEAKHYLVLVGRDSEYEMKKGSLKKYWHVHAGEIHRVLPIIGKKSFARPTGDIKLKSSIQVKKETFQMDWFRIPYIKFDQKEIAEEVFRAYFFTGKEDSNLRSKSQQRGTYADASNLSGTNPAEGMTKVSRNSHAQTTTTRSTSDEAPSVKKMTSLEARLKNQDSNKTARRSSYHELSTSKNTYNRYR